MSAPYRLTEDQRDSAIRRALILRDLLVMRMLADGERHDLDDFAREMGVDLDDDDE